MNSCPCACIVTPRVFLQTKASVGREDEGGRKEVALQEPTQDTSITAHLPQLGAHAVRLRSCAARTRGCTSEQHCALQKGLTTKAKAWPTHSSGLKSFLFVSQ